MKQYGYVRVSSRDQNIDRQIIALENIGLEKNQIFIDKESGKDFQRNEYQKMIKKIKDGDQLFVKSIDRLGRNYEEILKQWNYITREIKADIVVLDFPLLDTRNKINGVTGKFIADITLQILSYVAQIERDNIKQRQKEGIKAARKKGTKFGRPLLKLPDDFGDIYQKYVEKEISTRKGAQICGVSPHTFNKWVNEYREKLKI